MLKRADDPHYAGAMTKIRYNYRGSGCAPHLVTPWAYPEWVGAQPYAIAAEKSDTGAIVSSFLLNCDGGLRTEYNGFGGLRLFYFGNSAGTSESGNLFCRGYELGKLTDFYYGSPSSPPGGLPNHRQNFSFGHPRHIWDGRNHMTDEVATSGDESGLPGQVNHVVDGSNCVYDRIDSSGSLGLDSVMHNPYYVWLFKKKDERNQWTNYTRDGRRRVTRIDYPGGTWEEYTYNGFNQVETHTLPSHTAQNPAIQFYHYDSLQQLDWEYNSVDGWDARKQYTYYGASNHPEWTGLVETITDGRARTSGAPWSTR
jgi:hypothetical protein